MRKKIPFLSLAGEKQAYLNIVYILFSFPLSILFFCLLVTGLGLSLGFLFLFVGFIIFVGSLIMVRGFRQIEILTTRVFLNHNIPSSPDLKPAKGFWNRVNVLFTSLVTWKAFVFYLFIKLPLDIIIFSVAIGFLSVTLELLLAPILIETYWFHNEIIIDFLIDLVEDPYVLPFLGIIWMFVSLHVINGLSWIYRWVNTGFLRS